MQIKIFDLGLVEFKNAWEFQKEIYSAVKNNNLYSALILCRHYPVITLGRLTNKKNVLSSSEQLSKRGISVYETDRGGDVTYHGPGQLILYPILNLKFFKKDLHFFLRSMENLAIRILAELGIVGERKVGLTGVWCENNKIASIGIAIRNWITYHGLALNIKSDDLFNFSLIRPCGMDIMMTSVESVLKRKIEFEQVKKILIRRWQDGQSGLTGVG